MGNFLEILEEGYKELDDIEDCLEDFFLEDIGLDDVDMLREMYDLDDAEVKEITEIIEEALKKRVSSTGQVRKVLDRKTRSRRASITKKKSKAELKRIARKSARTRRKNPAAAKKAIRKRKKALRRRKQMGLK